MITLKDYAKLVKETRKAQQEFFKYKTAKNWTRAEEYLKKSKELEQKLDYATVIILTGQEQKSLF